MTGRARRSLPPLRRSRAGLEEWLAYAEAVELLPVVQLPPSVGRKLDCPDCYLTELLI